MMTTTPIAADTIEYYRSWLSYRQRQLRIPGVQVALIDEAGVRLCAAFGKADELEGTALTVDHAFRVASHSKTFTAVMILRLLEHDRLRLDDRIGDVVPTLSGTGLATRTIAELLAHGGGVVRDSTDGNFWQLHRPFPDHAALTTIAAQAESVVYGSDERFKYSNIGYGLLGSVIETVTGRTYAEHAAADVLEPLGLTRTGADLPVADGIELASGHTALSYAPQRRRIEHIGTGALAAATGFYATALELARFYAALLPGEERLLSATSQHRLRRQQWEVRGHDVRYGLGVFLDRIGEHDLFGHGGGFPGFITRTFACPDRSTVVSVLTNCIDGDAEGLATGIWKFDDLARGADHVRAADASRFTGRFSSLWGVLDIAALGDRLFIVDPAAADPVIGAAPLEVVDDDSLRIVGGPGGGSPGELVRLHRTADGRIASIDGPSGATMASFDESALEP